MRSQKGFTLIEILMVVMLVSILAAVSIPQFIDFRVDARNAATQSALGTLRTAITNQYAQASVRCGESQWATAAQLNANDITTGGDPCTTTEIATASDRAFVAGAALPENPWSGSTATPAQRNGVTACTGAGCTTLTLNCTGGAYTTASGGWCYNEATGQIRANSANNGQAVLEHTF